MAAVRCWPFDAPSGPFEQAMGGLMCVTGIGFLTGAMSSVGILAPDYLFLAAEFRLS